MCRSITDTNTDELPKHTIIQSSSLRKLHNNVHRTEIVRFIAPYGGIEAENTVSQAHSKISYDKAGHKAV